MKWKADHHSISLPFEETDDFYTTSGTVYYDFSKNYKRSDTFFVNGTIPFGFNGPADDWTGRKSSTMLHRQDKMYFINYMNDGSVQCTFMDMIVGNVRPDWFMDNRGAATSVQFLGNQHIYPMGSKQGDKPALVKQWRKKDFADMYFTMSVLADAGKDGHHWPVQLNVPGEGFGPDGLQSYWNHELLPEDSDDIFFVDKNLDCKAHIRPEGETGGPPTDMEEIPSKLNTYEAGWFELEYTASPQGPSLERAMHSASGKNNAEPAEAGTPGIVDLAGQGELRVCRQDSGELSVSANFISAENSWAAVGIRPASSGRCSMVPARVNVAHQVGADWLVHTGELVNEMRSGNTAGFLSSAQEVTEGVTVNREGKTTSLSFSEPAPADGTMKFSWAVGKSPVMSYHNARGCVEVENIPKCSDMKAAPQTAVARRTAGEAGGDSCQANVDRVQGSIADLTSKLDEYMKAGTGKPKCGQFKKMAGCRRWSLFCKWNAKGKKCLNL